MRASATKRTEKAITMIKANEKANRYTRYFNACRREKILPMTRVKFERLRT